MHANNSLKNVHQLILPLTKICLTICRLMYCIPMNKGAPLPICMLYQHEVQHIRALFRIFDTSNINMGEVTGWPTSSGTAITTSIDTSNRGWHERTDRNARIAVREVLGTQQRMKGQRTWQCRWLPARDNEQQLLHIR